MTQKTYDFLCTQKYIQLIPVTTRSKEQYERLWVFKSVIPCKYALLCNGGVLLVDGIEDEKWYIETLTQIQHQTDSLHKLKTIAKCFEPLLQIHDVHGLFFYVKHESPDHFARQLSDSMTTNQVSIYHDQHKVYCLPSSLNKGIAIERFKKRFGCNYAVAAGDSELDIPMLVCADTAIIPSSIEQQVQMTNKILISTSILSDGICDHLKTLQK